MDEILDWKALDLDLHELREIIDKTDRFIWKITEDRVSGRNYSHPYWTDRMKWVHMLMEGRFYEDATKTKIICTIRGNPLTFEYIIDSGLYKYCVCIFEIDRWIKDSKLKGKNYDIGYILKLRQKASTSKDTLTTDETKILNTVFYDGTTILECLSEYFRIFKNIDIMQPVTNIDGYSAGSKHKTRKTRKTKYKKTKLKKRDSAKTKNYYNFI